MLGARCQGALAAVVVIAAAAVAQTDAPIAFEVASIKPADPNRRGAYIRSTPVK